MAAYGGYQALTTFTARSVSVCVVTDFGFRQAKPNWEYQVKLWFAEVNRMYLPAGLHWETRTAGDAYREDTSGNLDDRKSAMDEQVSCKADVILGFSGQRDPATPVVVSPFSHSALISARTEDSDAIMVTRVARTLARLFGVPTRTAALITTDNPDDGVIDDASLKLIATLRRYDFSRGASALPGAWERRAERALNGLFTGKTPNPEMEAHLTIARAYTTARMRAAAIAQFRLAIQAAPRDPQLRFEMALEMNADGMSEDAIRELREAARLDPDDARPHAAMGGIFFNRRRYEEAVDELRVATRLDPRQGSYQTLLGRALSSQLGSAGQAAAAFEAALRAEPHQENAIIGLANLKSAEEIMDLRTLEKQVRDEPNSPDAHLRLGVALAAGGNLDGARAELSQAIRLSPKAGAAHVALARIKYSAGDYAGANTEIQAARTVGAVVPNGLADAVSRKLAPSQ